MEELFHYTRSGGVKKKNNYGGKQDVFFFLG